MELDMWLAAAAAHQLACIPEICHIRTRPSGQQPCTAVGEVYGMGSAEALERAASEKGRPGLGRDARGKVRGGRMEARRVMRLRSVDNITKQVL